MTSCLQCNSFWIGIVISIIALVLLGIAVFNTDFYFDNYYTLYDFIRFGILFGLMIFCLWQSESNIRSYCNNSGDLLNFGWGIACAVGCIFFIMLAIYFLPIATIEAEIRMLADDPQKQDQRISNLDCKIFLSNYDEYLEGYKVGDTFKRSEVIAKKLKECMIND